MKYKHINDVTISVTLEPLSHDPMLRNPSGYEFQHFFAKTKGGGL